MRALAAALVFALLCTNANASGINLYNEKAIDASIKCELSKVDAILRRGHPEFKALQARIKVDKTDTKNVKAGATVGLLIFNAGASYNSKVVGTRSIEFDRNILEANNPNCAKSFAVDLGLFSCFRDDLEGFGGFNLADKNSKITCALDTSATAELTASGKFKVWILNAGPSGDASITREWKIQVTAPPGADKPDKKDTSS